MISKKKFEELNGFDEKFRIAFNDVDFCLRLREKGYYNIYTPYVELYHHESVSVGTLENGGSRDLEEFRKEVEMMKERWYKIIHNDPFYNKNFRWENTNYEIKVAP
jgi:GT2 family glycosyltransferase